MRPLAEALLPRSADTDRAHALTAAPLRFRRFAGVVPVILCLAGCAQGTRTPKAPGSALWLTSASPKLELAQIEELERVGIGELFVEAGILRWEAGQPAVERAPLPSLPRRTPATLVVRGQWAESEAPPAVALLPSLAQLLEGARARGMTPLGLHFDLSEVEQVGSYASFLWDLREDLEDDLLVSTTLPRRHLDDPEVEELAGAADYVVAFLYGQRPGEAEVAAAWDFQELQRSLARLELLRVPYLLGVVTVGTASHLGPRGERLGQITETDLQSLVKDSRLGLDFGFTLQGVDRQVYSFEARTAATLGAWKLRPGDRIRVVATACYHLEELGRLLGEWDLPGLLGNVYYRLPAPQEGLSLTVANLLAALGPERAGPELAVEVDRVGGSRGVQRIRVRLRNLRPEATDVATVEHNYVQLTARNGSFGTVRPGDFERYDLLGPGADGELVRTLKQPRVLRLYLSYLGPEEEVSSGTVLLWRHRGRQPELLLEASFLEPGGRSVTYGPTEWSG